MTTLTIRPALPQHRQGLARCIAEGFERDFSALCKDTEKTARAIEGGIRTSRFWVAEEKDIPAGTAALSDCRERAVRTDRAGYLKHFGPLRGRLALLVLKGEFEAPLDFPPETGYLEFVTVARRCRRQGIATALVQKILSSGLYQDYILDVVNTNTGAFRCYEKMGFRPFRQVPEKHSRQKGFDCKIYMKYHP